MSTLLEMLGQQFGGDTVKRIGNVIGADEAATEKGLAAALPMLLGGLAKNAADERGAAALHGAIERDHDGGLLDNLGDLLGDGAKQQQATSQGAGILKHILGGRQERVTQGVSRSSGLSNNATAKLMQLLAPLLMGAVGKQQKQQGMSSGGLSKWLGQERERFEEKAPQGGGILGALLDTDGDGDLDMSDLLSHGKRFLFKR